MVTHKDRSRTKAISDLPSHHDKYPFVVKFGHPSQVQNILSELSIVMLRSEAVLSQLQLMGNYERHQGNRMSTVETPNVASDKAAQNVPASFLCPGIDH